MKPFVGGVDSKMVWNPCAKETQIAFVPEIPPVRNDRLLTGPWPAPCFPLPGTADKHPGPGRGLVCSTSFHLASGLAPTLNRRLAFIIFAWSRQGRNEQLMTTHVSPRWGFRRWWLFNHGSRRGLQIFRWLRQLY
jgi:hypothetical protein